MGTKQPEAGRMYGESGSVVVGMSEAYNVKRQIHIFQVFLVAEDATVDKGCIRTVFKVCQ